MGAIAGLQGLQVARRVIMRSCGTGSLLVGYERGLFGWEFVGWIGKW